jgi:hypothetical protein
MTVIYMMVVVVLTVVTCALISTAAEASVNYETLSPDQQEVIDAAVASAIGIAITIVAVTIGNISTKSLNTSVF